MTPSNVLNEALREWASMDQTRVFVEHLETCRARYMKDLVNARLDSFSDVAALQAAIQVTELYMHYLEECGAKVSSDYIVTESEE